MVRGDDVLDRYDELVARADAQPLAVGGGTPLTGEDVRRLTQEHLVTTLSRPSFAAAIQRGLAGDGGALAVGPDGTYVALQEHVTTCMTTPSPVRTFAELRQLARMVERIAPRTAGASRAWDAVAGCIGWPSGSDAAVERPGPRRDTPPALLLQSTHNALAPYANAFALSRQLPGSRVLSREGDDYSLVLFSACAAAAFDAYTVEGRLPEPGALCTD